MHDAGRAAGLATRATCRTQRRSSATYLLEAGTDIWMIQALLGRQDVRTTMIYTFTIDHGPPGVVSLLDH
ncbi:tyrosine-type recombinase/integrase [Sorangium sp. So ce1099]|uniref:tyrosine-type recombinase/integrase n=1 Tax=Sorangium sp. So ce1099 TaxID=3133331 RepID=UPI003F60AF18